MWMIFCIIALVTLHFRSLVVLLFLPIPGLRLVLECVMYGDLGYLQVYIILSKERFSLSCFRVLVYTLLSRPRILKGRE